MFQALVDAQIKLQDLLFAQGTSKQKKVWCDGNVFFRFEKDWVSDTYGNPSTELIHSYKYKIKIL